MRRLFLCITLCAVALIPLGAAAQQKTQAQTCVGHTGNPTETKRFYVGAGTSAAAMKTYLERKVICPSACWDVTIALSGGVEFPARPYLDMKITGTDLCQSPKPAANQIESVLTPLPDPNKARSCARGMGLPSVTVTSQPITGYVPQLRIEKPKSRCDPKVTSTIDAFASGDIQGGFNSASQLADPAEPTPEPQTLGTAAGNEQLLSAFKSAGVSEDKAKRIIADNPNTVNDYLKALEEGDTTKRDEALRKLTLNANLSDAEQRAFLQAAETAERSPTASPDVRPGSQETFDTKDKSSTALPTQCGIEGLAGNIMRIESACGRINSNPLSSVRGPYHFLCDTWRAYVRTTGVGNPDCAYRNDPQMSTQVMNAMMGRFDQQYGGACRNMGIPTSACQYAIHVFGEGGFKNMLAAYQSNPNNSAFSLCGTALSSKACSNNRSIFSRGGTIAGVFGELERRLGGSNVISSVAQGGSPFNLLGGAHGYAGLGGSPLAYSNPAYAMYRATDDQLTCNSTGCYLRNWYGGASPVSSAGPISSGGSQSTGGSISTGGPVSTGGSISTGGPISTGGSISTGGDAPSVPPPPTPVASIIVQPKEVSEGKPVVVAWSSVGMRSSPTCRVLIASTTTAVLGQGNEGSEKIVLGSVGEYTFTLECIALSGIEVRQATSVLVQ